MSIPLHKAAQRFDFGIFLKGNSFVLPEEPVGYAHRDDYYVFGMVDSGSCRVAIDFKEYRLSEGEIIAVQPGQVHRVVDVGDARRSVLFVDGAFVGPAARRVLAEYALCPAPFRPADIQRAELGQLFAMIARRIGDFGDDDSKGVVRSLSDAVIGLITEEMRKAACRLPANRRHVEIMLAFRDLLAKDDRIARSPSRYAEALHISPVYLNEVVKGVTGENASGYIRNEIVLRAKRMLVYTQQQIGEIAHSLGFDDSGYFTRLFTRLTGMSPTAYRMKYLE